VSLKDFGVRPLPVVREPARDRHDSDLRACPECGEPVGDLSTWRIESPDVVDDVSVGKLVTRGWVCDGHHYDVILPLPVTENAPTLGSSWTTVRLQFSDTRVRHVAVPKREVSPEGSQ